MWLIPIILMVAFPEPGRQDCRNSMKTDRTVSWYDANSGRFTDLNDDTDHSADYRYVLSFVGDVSTLRVLDIGCAQGRDIVGFQNLGVKEVVGIEPSGPLAEFARKRSSARVIQKSLQAVKVGQDLQPGSVDLIWAMASFLHIPEAEQVEAYEKVKKLLARDGVLFATYKVGDSERIETRGDHELTYTDMTLDRIQAIVAQVPGLELVTHKIQEDYNRPGLQWISVIIRRTS